MLAVKNTITEEKIVFVSAIDSSITKFREIEKEVNFFSTAVSNCYDMIGMVDYKNYCNGISKKIE
jgi:hypothetical protein